jgi:hypothetical protein
MKLTKEGTRQYPRFPTALKGLYFIEGKRGKGANCTIINISVNGAGLKFYAHETIIVNSKLSLEILPPDGKETINVEGTIRWVKQGRKDCVCGIMLTEKLNKVQMAMLKV